MKFSMVRKYSVITFLIYSALLYVGLLQANEASNDRPNIILIVADNQSPSLLGAYGNSEISTPNIDQLAQQGILFSNAFASSRVCSPTRATLLTGLLPSQAGVHNALPPEYSAFGHEYWSAIEEFRTIPYTLSALGYKTALIGKYHLGSADTAQLGFDYWLTFPSGHTKSFFDVEVIDNSSRYTVKEHLTDFWTQKAVDYIGKQDAHTPFFMMLSYNGTYMLPPAVTQPSVNRHWQRYSEHTPTFPQLPVHPFLQNWAMATAAPTDEMQTDATHT